MIVASEVCRHIVCLQKSVQPLPETLCRSMRRNRMDRVVTGHEQIVSSEVDTIWKRKSFLFREVAGSFLWMSDRLGLRLPAGIQVLLDPFPLFFSSRNVCWSLEKHFFLINSSFRFSSWSNSYGDSWCAASVFLHLSLVKKQLVNTSSNLHNNLALNITFKRSDTCRWFQQRREGNTAEHLP